MRTIGKILSEAKREVQSVAKASSEEKDSTSPDTSDIAESLQQTIQNSLDMLRLINISYPTETAEKTEVIDSSTFLLPPSSIDNSEENSDDEDVDDDSDDEDDDNVKSNLTKKRSRYAKKRTQLADEKLVI
jgi:hypothetical protein